MIAEFLAWATFVGVVVLLGLGIYAGYKKPKPEWRFLVAELFVIFVAVGASSVPFIYTGAQRSDIAGTVAMFLLIFLGGTFLVGIEWGAEKHNKDMVEYWRRESERNRTLEQLRREDAEWEAQCKYEEAKRNRVWREEP